MTQEEVGQVSSMVKTGCRAWQVMSLRRRCRHCCWYQCYTGAGAAAGFLAMLIESDAGVQLCLFTWQGGHVSEVMFVEVAAHIPSRYSTCCHSASALLTSRGVTHGRAGVQLTGVQAVPSFRVHGGHQHRYDVFLVGSRALRP